MCFLSIFAKVYKKPVILLLTALLSVSVNAQEASFMKIAFERLPSLEAPRGNHQTILLNGEVTVVGGHTTGYKPLETLEYYKGGSWHSITTTWPHDGGAFAQLPDGKLFMAGGHAEAFGIGQSWGAEIYDPATHTFSPIGIMNRKRTLASAMAMPDGRVLIAGNWRGRDGIEVYTPGEGFSAVKSLEPGWSFPSILVSSRDDVLLLGCLDTYGNFAGTSVERLQGPPLVVPLLEQWIPCLGYGASCDEFKIADYTYLILAYSRTDGRAAILKVSGEDFSVLELESPIPEAGPFGDGINWSGEPQVDRSARVAWIQGFDVPGRIYFARISYDATFDGGKASVQYYYAENGSEEFPKARALLLPGGKMFLAGGVAQAEGADIVTDDNFHPYADVYLFHTEDPEKAGMPVWAIVAGVLLLAGAIVLIASRRKKASPEEVAEKQQKLNEDLMEEMSRLIQEKELFLRKDLRVADIAQELATNQTYVSLLVNNLSGDNFATMIGGYRIRYAQNLMREHPEMVHADVAEASGFASRTAFLRTFKAQTGLTPTEWKQQEGIS
jgi:AraC-like DNA-binding protein